MLIFSTRERLARWTARLMGCMLATAALTAFFVHLGAADPWFGGVAMPATVWLAWTQAAIRGLNGKTVDSRAITVNEARPKEDRPGGFGAGSRRGG